MTAELQTDVLYCRDNLARVRKGDVADAHVR